ncbi:hypothetical protein [Desulfobacula sp.]|uniref:hypothetical protein n=1 Tax=Desulfobacula sp. TaxID=2593537 RepID=UPI002615C1E5|nr:hypothetical protein [Desulfobacula sp.]
MNDFLKPFRSSHGKNPSDPTPNHDGGYYPQNDRRNYQDRRSNTSQNLESLLINLKDLLPKLVNNTSAVTVSLEKMIAQNELLVEAKIRENNAISFFFDNLNKLFSEDFVFSSSDSKPKATASYASGTHYTKDDIITIIGTMRKEGATFATIAAYLKEKGIPTFSGRGEWHAQTIHRLCK